MTDVEERLDALYRRMQTLEDERAVHNVLIRYGVAADAGHGGRLADLYTDDCHIDIDHKIIMNGRVEAARIFAEMSDTSQKNSSDSSPKNICAHMMGPFIVSVDGDRASATGYVTFYMKDDDQVSIWRQSHCQWELAKKDGVWQILKRISRGVGQSDARAMFSDALDEVGSVGRG